MPTHHNFISLLRTLYLVSSGSHLQSRGLHQLRCLLIAHLRPGLGTPSSDEGFVLVVGASIRRTMRFDWIFLVLHYLLFVQNEMAVCALFVFTYGCVFVYASMEPDDNHKSFSMMAHRTTITLSSEQWSLRCCQLAQLPRLMLLCLHGPGQS